MKRSFKMSFIINNIWQVSRFIVRYPGQTSVDSIFMIDKLVRDGFFLKVKTLFKDIHSTTQSLRSKDPGDSLRVVYDHYKNYIKDI